MRRVLTFLILLLLIPSFIFSIGFGYHVLEIRTTPEFGKGVFPSSLVYQFNLPVPDMIEGNSTLLTFRLDNGLDFRYIDKDPNNGRYFSQYPELNTFVNQDARTYSVHFDEFKLLFAQGFGRTSFSTSDIVTASFAFGGRFEKAYESLSWMRDKYSTEGAFWIRPGVERYASWVGYPELKGDKSYTAMFMDFTLDLDFMNDQITVKNGARLSNLFRYSPAYLNFTAGKGDFMYLSSTFELAYTPVAIHQNKRSSLTYFSALIGNDLNYQLIIGDTVPTYIIDNDIFGLRIVSTAHVIKNRTYITIFGPQIVAKDLYPSLTLFNDVALSIGNVLNTVEKSSIAECAASFGLKAEFNIYNFCQIFYEIGYAYKNQFKGDTGLIKAKFGFSLGV